MSFFDSKYTFTARLALITSQLFYKHAFGRFGRHSRILNPIRIANSKYMYIGNNVYIDSLAYLVVDTSLNDSPSLVIEDDVKLGNLNHISCVSSVVIGRNVLTADRVYISDNFHCFENISIPVKNQGIGTKGITSIGDESWLGDNVAVISCHIGKHCIIGANSVVTHDIPDYSVAVGAPAIVIKQYDFYLDKWISV